MDKIKIGIPRSIYYYYDGNLWTSFFQKLGCFVEISPPTNKQIMDAGIHYATDEMCLSMKNYIGHVSYLIGKCDFILLPRVANYGIENQTCTNFLATFDIIHNLFDASFLHYNIDLEHHETEEKAFLKMGTTLGFSKKIVKKAYQKAKEESKTIRGRMISQNIRNLKSNSEKILIVGHPYNVHDSYIGSPILTFLTKMGIQIIYSDQFVSSITNRLSYQLSKEIYWKYNKENIGAIPLLKDKIDGVIFLSTFPCGPDSLVNELVIRKIKLPYLNLVLDDLDGLAGLETRLESFVDVIRERKKHYV